MIKRDSFIFGLLIGLVLPVLLYVILWLGNKLFVNPETINEWRGKDSIQLISIFINLFPIRYYFVTLKYEQTGRGILFMTFILGILFYIIRLA